MWNDFTIKASLVRERVDGRTRQSLTDRIDKMSSRYLPDSILLAFEPFSKFLKTLFVENASMRSTVDIESRVGVTDHVCDDDSRSSRDVRHGSER
jgi:hypothetical protein